MFRHSCSFSPRTAFGCALFIGCLLALGSAISAQERQNEKEPEKEPSDDPRLAALTRRAELLAVAFPDDPERAAPKLSKSPVLRCSDPTRREEDGALWLWLDGNRPLAALCVFQIGEFWSLEHLSLTDQALQLKVSGRPEWTWKPSATERPWIAVGDDVPETTTARKRAMRKIAGEMEANEFHEGQTYALRLLPCPLYEYSDSDRGLLDGALFALVNGTNPEALVQIEVRAHADNRSILAAFARLSAAEITVKRLDKEIWKADAIRRWNSREGYFSVRGSDPLAGRE